MEDMHSVGGMYWLQVEKPRFCFDLVIYWIQLTFKVQKFRKRVKYLHSEFGDSDDMEMDGETIVLIYDVMENDG